MNGIQRWSRLYYTPVVWHWLSDICFHIYSVIIQRLTLIEWYSALITSVLHPSRVALVEWRLLSHLQCHHTTLNIDWMVFSADHVCITRQSCGTGWVIFVFHIYSVIIQRLTLIEWYSALITSVLHPSRVALVEWYLFSYLQCHHTTLNIDWMVFSADHVCITRQSCGTGWAAFAFTSTVSSYNAYHWLNVKQMVFSAVSRLYYTPVVWHWLSGVCFHIYSVIIQRLTLIEWYSALITSVLHASRVALVEWRLLSHLQCHHTTLIIDWMIECQINGIQRWSRLYYTPVVWHWLSGVCFHIYSVIIQRLTLIEWYSALITSVLHPSRVALVEWYLFSYLQCHHTTLNIDWMVFSADHVCITRQSCGTGWAGVCFHIYSVIIQRLSLIECQTNGIQRWSRLYYTPVVWHWLSGVCFHIYSVIIQRLTLIEWYSALITSVLHASRVALVEWRLLSHLQCRRISL